MATRDARLRKIEVPLPEGVLDELGGLDADLPARAREAIVLHLFQTGRMSAGYAAESLGIGRLDFYELLRERGVPLLDYREGDVGRDADELGRDPA